MAKRTKLHAKIQELYRHMYRLQEIRYQLQQYQREQRKVSDARKH